MREWKETPEETAVRLKKWRTGVGDWYGSREWTHFVHITTGERREPSTNGERIPVGDKWRVRQLRKVRGVWRVPAPAMPWAQLHRAFVDEFCRYCTKVALGPVCYAYAIEGGALGDRPHLHALLYGTALLDCKQMADAWRHGRAEVSVYDPRRGAAYYLAKEIGGRILDYGVSARLPPMRAGGDPRRAA